MLGVDESAKQRALMEEAFPSPKYHTVVAPSGEDALKVLAGKEFDVILVEIEMTEMDGFEFCKKVRADLDHPLLQIFLVSAQVTPQKIREATEAGADEFVIKPFEAEKLRIRLDQSAEQKVRLESLDSSDLVLYSLARLVETKDVKAGDHCDRLEHMCRVFAAELKLSAEDIETLVHASVLHDIGKLAIPDAVLMKQGKLDEDEWHLVKRHPAIGATLCENVKRGKGVVDIIRHHHEKFDGSGYPDGLKGEEIPFLARVFQIVDMYDAMTNDRVYNHGFDRDKAIKVMYQGVQRGAWDGDLMGKFLTIASKRPGDLVRPAQVRVAMTLKKINQMLDLNIKAEGKNHKPAKKPAAKAAPKAAPAKEAPKG